MKRAAILLIAILMAGPTGCIRSRAIITSDPPEAMVRWNNEYRGRTPIEIPFTWNWHYQIDVQREGYEPVTEIVKLRTRPWLLEPLGFILEALPIRVTDTRSFHYELVPQDEALAD